MTTKKITLALPPDVYDVIEANSTSTRTKAAFVADCIRKAMRSEKDGDGALERLAAVVEKATQAMERTQWKSGSQIETRPNP